MPRLDAEPPALPPSLFAAAQEQQQFQAAVRATMATQAALDQEEAALVAEARSVGMAWPDIATLLPTRSMAELRRRHSACAAVQAKGIRRTEQSQSHHMRPHQRPAPAAISGGESPRQPLVAPPPIRPPGAPKLVGDDRITLLKPQAAPPSGFTVPAWHGLKDLSGVRFFGAADVVDPDQEEDAVEVFAFDLSDSSHSACFNLGEDAEGNTLISWSQLHALYTLPDGSIWAEHSDFLDRSDMEELAQKTGKDASAVLAGEPNERELFKRAGRRHTRLAATEYQCWVFRDRLPSPLPDDVTSASDAFFWRTCFDPDTLQPVEPSVM